MAIVPSSRCTIPSSYACPRPCPRQISVRAYIHVSKGLLVDETGLCLKTSQPFCQQHKDKRATYNVTMQLAVEARLGGGSGAGVLERPGLDQSQSPPEPSVEEGGEMGKLRQRRRFGGGDRYRVLLLDHQRHTESQVASVLPKVVPSVTPDEARRCFRDSREKGAGLVTVTVKEHAEFYAQMMARCGLRSSIEPDTDTL